MMYASASHRWGKPAEKRNRLCAYLLILTVTALLVLHVGAQMLILSIGRDIQKTRAERARIEAEISTLELRVADLGKGSRIKRIAIEHLGMTLPVGAPQKLF